jgi:hypothetical protein
LWSTGIESGDIRQGVLKPPGSGVAPEEHLYSLHLDSPIARC